MLSLYYNPFRVEVPEPFVLKGLAMPSRNPFFLKLPQRPITSSKSTLSWTGQSLDSRQFPQNVTSNLTVSQSPNLGLLRTQFPSPCVTTLIKLSTHLRNHWLDRIVGHVYSDWQPYNREEIELKTITLRFLSLARTETPTLDWACALAIGTTFSKWVRYNHTRREYMTAQLDKCIPDYDPTLSPKKSAASEKPESKKEKLA